MGDSVRDYFLRQRELREEQPETQFTYEELAEIAKSRGPIITALRHENEALRAQIEKMQNDHKVVNQGYWKQKAYDQLRSRFAKFVRDEFEASDFGWRVDFGPDDYDD